MRIERSTMKLKMSKCDSCGNNHPPVQPRYDLVSSGGYQSESNMEEHEDGDYERHEDAEASRAELRL